MTINEQIKILDNKIRSNQAQYDLDRQNAKISALSNGEVDMGYKPDVVQKAKFEYSPLGQVFNKGLDTSEKQVGLLKRLKNIKDKTDRQLEENKGNQLGVKSIGYTVKKNYHKKQKICSKNLIIRKSLLTTKNLVLQG